MSRCPGVCAGGKDASGEREDPTDESVRGGGRHKDNMGTETPPNFAEALSSPD